MYIRTSVFVSFETYPIFNKNIMKWSMKWSNGNVLSRNTFFWPYMVSCGTLQSPLNIRWRWCTPMCHWLRDNTLSSKSNPYLHHVGTQNRQWNILNERRSNLKLICVFLLDLLQFESYTVQCTQPRFQNRFVLGAILYFSTWLHPRQLQQVLFFPFSS